MREFIRLTLWRFVHGRIEAVHMIASITVVTEQKLILGQQHKNTFTLKKTEQMYVIYPLALCSSVSRIHLVKTYVIFRGAAHVTTLALDALPAVRLHGRHHYRSELQAGRVAWNRFFFCQIFFFFYLCFLNSVQSLSHLSVHSQSRTPAPLTGRSCDSFSSPPGRNHSNYWATRDRLGLSLELKTRQNLIFKSLLCWLSYRWH